MSLPRQKLIHHVVRGAAALGVRQILVIALNVAGSVLLARLLSPTEYGLFAVVTFVLVFLTAFGDVGLGASLIRSAQEPPKQTYHAVFSAQLMITLLMGSLVMLLAPVLARAYGLPAEGAWIFRLIGLSLPLAAIQASPQVQLERRLAFDRLAVVEVAQALVFNGAAVTLAYMGWGAVSFALALLARSFTGALLAIWLSAYRPRWRWDVALLRPHLKFGLAYQGSNVLAVVNAAVTPTLIVAFFGLNGAGMVAWATGIVGYLQQPLLLFNRLLYPTFSRLQNPRDLSHFSNVAYVATAVIFYGVLALVWSNTPQFVQVIYTEKWLPALPLLYGLSLAALFVPMSIPNGALANALGLAGLVFRINVARSVGFWILMYIAIRLTDQLWAFVIVQAVAEWIHLALYLRLRRDVPGLNAPASQVPVLLSAAVAVVCGRSLSLGELEAPQALAIAVLLSGLVYLTVLGLLSVMLARMMPTSVYGRLWKWVRRRKLVNGEGF
nr:oligosaccharide flippase family protein [Deinobacterium chartae]